MEEVLNDIMVKRSLREHKVLEKEIGGEKVTAIQFTSDPYCDIIFSYGKVDFVPQILENGEEHLVVKFDYEIHKEPKELYIKENLERDLGDFLMLLIAQQMEDGELIYSGGTDENRESNLSESDVKRELQSQGYTVSDPHILLGED